MDHSEEKTRKPLQNLSIKEFISIFKRIDEQILQLHQCSSDDFLGLNTDFKQYYRQSKSISENASEIFNSLTQTATGELIHDLEILYKALKQIQNSFSKHLSKSIEQLKEMNLLLDKLFLPVKNLNQDLMTLKFLLANIKISNAAFKEQFRGNSDSILVKFNQVINDFKIFSFQNETNLSILKEQVKKTLNALEKIRGRNIHDLDMILNHIHFGIILFAEKHEEVSLLIPELTTKTKSSSQSIADIITNLQYHDIIRQKMEHVRKTHQKVLEDLERSKPSDEAEGNDRLLIRIRDIANLQSAQLVHANKEYQQAIENITQKFIAIGEDMTTISAMCQEFSASHENSEELQLQGLLDKLHDSANILLLFVEAGDSYSGHFDILSASIVNANKSTTQFSEAIKALNSIAVKTIETFSEPIANDHQLKSSLIQVKDLCDEVEKFEGIIQQVFGSIKEIEQKIQAEIELHQQTANNAGSFTQAADTMNSIISLLNQKNITIERLLDENLNISQTISREVRGSINKIRYYDFFDKVIVDIIGEFNQISTKLRTVLGSENKGSNQDLDSIKGLYTMASEHNIHDKVVKNKGDVDLFEDEAIENDEDDDNLELF